MRSTVRSAAFAALVALGGCGLDWTVPEDDREPKGTGAGGGASTSTTTAAEATAATSSTSSATTGATAASATSTTSAGTSGAGGAPVQCDTLADCDECATCAETGPCQGPVDACFANPECSAYDDCQWSCRDIFCLDDCAAAYPTGEALWYDAAYCVTCVACPAHCAEACSTL